MTGVAADAEGRYVFPALAAERAAVYEEITRRSEEILERAPMHADLAYGPHHPHD